MFDMSTYFTCYTFCINGFVYRLLAGLIIIYTAVYEGGETVSPIAYRAF